MYWWNTLHNFFMLFLYRLCSAATGPSDAALQCRAETEHLLLRTYNIQLPRRPAANSGGFTDPAADHILRRFHPVVRTSHTPLGVQGDGNCFYRSLSRGLYGHEYFHLLIRLLTALEIALHPTFYDTSAATYQDLIADNRVVCNSYAGLLGEAATPGHYAETLHFYAVLLPALLITFLVVLRRTSVSLLTILRTFADVRRANVNFWISSAV